ncbi:MAG: hypothetical protein H6739_13925 [Alphaproteobacteria bacterium]|nr:hypothetical protein [Alphaproteobacteria bacterium]
MMTWRWLLLVLLAPGCGEKEYTVDELCAGEGPVEMTLGPGTGDGFTPFVEGEEVDIAIAPQGGYGIEVRASTLGLLTNRRVQVTVSSYWGDETTGTFLWGAQPLYCMEDGAGLMWGVVVPFDPELFPTVEDLAVLDGERVTLELVAVDEEGDQAVGQVEVIVRVQE